MSGFIDNGSIRILVLSFVFVFFVSSFGWSGHSVYTYLVVKNSGLNFDFLVDISSKDFQEDRVYNTSRVLEEYLSTDVAGNKRLKLLEDCLLPKYEFIIAPSVNNKLPAWQIISLYSAFPDIGIDYLKDVSWIQDTFLGNSQGLRHGKVKIGPIEIFEADWSFLYFLRKSKELLRAGNTYWGLRFFGYSLHYLEDIMQPYHVRPGTVWELMMYPFDASIQKMLRNLHTAYDRMLVYLILHDYENLENVIRQAKPIHFNSDEQLITEVFMYSYSKFFKVHELQKSVFSDIIVERAPSMEDFIKKSNREDFNILVKETYEIILVMSSVIKGLIFHNLRIFNMQ